jgi:hypothetical protein
MKRMKQKLFVGSLALLAFMASCSSSNDDLIGGAPSLNESSVPITFGSYLGRTATSRAGMTGVQTTSTLATNGFGLFAYYTDNSSYGTSSTPNFMYNTKVTGTTSEGTTTWTYSPLRYWPNETGTDNNGATSEGTDHLSFFAYAPYVEATTNTGAVTENTVGITALTKNSDAGDPKVSYTVASDPAKSVDLLWGVSNTATWDNVTGTALNLTEGLPYLNLIKPKTDQKVSFNFKHALSRLGLTVQGAFDQVAAGGTLTDAKITVAKVEITGENFAAKGVLNLNNTEAGVPLWETSATDAGTLSLTLDGDNLNKDIKDAGDGKKAADQPAGVTATSQSLLKDNTYFMFIPGTATTEKPLVVKITYYTTTDDENLADGYTRVQNVITKKISAADPGLKFEAGKSYTLNLVLGMTSVKVSATVADWTDGSSTQVDLPINVQ